MHSRAPHLGGMNGDVQSDLSTLDFKKGEHIEDFHSRILRLQQEINISVETVSPTILLFHYMRVFSKSNKLKSSIAPKMMDIITLFDNNVKSAV